MTASLAAIRRRIIACERCPRLRAHCARVARDKRAAYRDQPYWGRPVPGFGDRRARVLVLGLAPAAHGANRTGRVFTGDSSADFLMRAMHGAGFASSATSRARDDGLALTDAYIAAVVRCAPPDNRPTPAEIANCRPHIEAELRALANLRVIVALGKVAFDAYWRIAIGPGQQPRPAATLRARTRLPGRRGLLARGVVPSEPAEHQHRPADARHAGRRIRAGPPPRRVVIRAGTPHARRRFGR